MLRAYFARIDRGIAAGLSM